MLFLLRRYRNQLILTVILVLMGLALYVSKVAKVPLLPPSSPTPTPVYVGISVSATTLQVGETFTVIGENANCIGRPLMSVKVQDNDTPSSSTLISIYALGGKAISNTNASQVIEPVSIQWGNTGNMIAVLRARAPGVTHVSVESDGENYCHPPGVSETWGEYSKRIIITVRP